MGRMKSALEANTDELKAEGNVPGTAVSMWDLVSASKSLHQFKDDCRRELEAGKECHAAFNLLGGKRMTVEVGFERGMDVTVESKEENGQRRARRMNIQPNGTLNKGAH